MGFVLAQPMRPMVNPDDPDDHRPNTTWSIALDPGSNAGMVRELTVLSERCAVGDTVPLHTHPIDEVVIVVSGVSDFTLGDERRLVHPGGVVFIPAGVPHANRNGGEEPMVFHCLFASETIEISMLERNPRPGTEGDPPQPPIRIDARRVFDEVRVSGS
jgi:quercetin dioxygenase-like cupin family protein